MIDLKPDILYIDARVRGLPATQRILGNLSGVQTELIADVRSMQKPTNFLQAKRQWLLTETSVRKIFRQVEQTATHLRLAADFITNTPYDCSFAPLPIRMARNPFMSIMVNVEEALAELGRRCAAPTGKQVVLRCGEGGDALAMDHITKFSETLVPFFSFTPNAHLELWTRTNNVAPLLNLQHRGCTTVVFAITPESVIAQEEEGTASLKSRIVAARNLADRGYKIIFSIDPVIQYEGWEEDYNALIAEIFNSFPRAALAGIELSCFHYPRGLASKVADRFPKSRIFYGELVPVNGSYRYFRPIRQQMYTHLLNAIKEHSEETSVQIVQEHGLISEMESFPISIR